jgi:predicted DNA binding protein
MISARFRIRLPEGIWVGELSREYPRATLRLLSGYKIDDRAIELGEVRRRNPDEVVEAMRAHSSIHDHERLEADDQRSLGKYETTDTALYEFVEQSGFTIEFPVDVQNGWYEFDLTGTREEFETLRDTLEASPLPFELESLVSTTDSESLLTARQRELLDVAVREGYFEVPRECTLSELAETVGVDKSTASTVLRRGEATLLKWYLSGPAGQR